MFRKKNVVFAFFTLVAVNTVFSQAVAIDTALSNAAKEISESVEKGTKIAVLNISSDYAKLSDYVIDEIIVNLVNTKSFQVLPRSTIELELAKGELDFQYTGDVSDESQKSIGKFLGAGTIISGSITRDSAHTYRIVINAIDLESFTYQISYRTLVQNNSQMKELIAASSGNFYKDYTTGERFGIGALNIFGGIGSLLKKEHIGWVTTGFEAAGLIVLLGSVPMTVDEENEGEKEFKQVLIGTGVGLIGVGVVVGFIIPFFHHKPDNTNISHNNFPFEFKFVSSNNVDINGLGISYKMKF